MQLYPFKFNPILKTVIWGGNEICKFKQIQPTQDGIGESWEISGVKENVSVVANGILEGTSLDTLMHEAKGQLLGEKVYEKFGATFPLLIKFIDAQDDLSIQVHPDDTLAKKRHNSFGKTEMWYVIKATPDAFLYSGFAEKITSEEYESRIANNTFTDTLQRFSVKEGDVFFLPAGRVHAIGAGCFIAEIQQTSDITYRIYDYDRRNAAGNPRELHTDLAKDAIDFSVHDSNQTQYVSKENLPVELATCAYFTTNLMTLNDKIHRDYAALDSFVIYICVEGSAKISDNKENKTEISQGESILIPADTQAVKIIPEKNTKIIETYVVG